MYDVCVIGSGISGLNFALRAAEKYQRVLIITKKKLAEASTNFAQGGIAAVLSKTDDFTQHVQDTMEAGSFHNSRRAVEYMVRHGPQAIKRLIELGVPFATKNGELLLTREGGHGKRRIAFVGDMTGQAIEKVLVAKAKKNPRITILEHTFAAELLVKNNVCQGVLVHDGTKFRNIFGGITVLATGGIGQLFEHTTNPAIATGDGIAMAARVGCKFRDCEFVQFHPTALSWETLTPSQKSLRSRRARLPDRQALTAFLISEAVRGEGAYLRNSRGERFMKSLHRLAELAPRDVVARAIFKEERHGPVFLDLRHKPKTFLQTRFPHIYQKLLSYGLHMERDLIPVSPAAHYLCGGISVNLRGETGIQNLYAFGEVAGTGVHGANRLASNSLLEALVFSDRILRSPITKKKVRAAVFSLPKPQPLSQKDKKQLQEIRQSLQKIMWENVGVVRTQKSLSVALHQIQALEKITKKIPALTVETIETQNMFTAAKIIAKAAKRREKSLGCHFVLRTSRN